MSKDREYVCAYPHCLHHGEKVKASEVVVVGGKRYHWDCATTREQLGDLRKYYHENIDNEVNLAQLSKVLNTLIFSEGLEIEYIKFALEYYSKFGMKINSPFALTYLKKNNMMRRKWINNN